VAGVAWMTGLLAGLAEVGQDVTGVDLVMELDMAKFATDIQPYMARAAVAAWLTLG
jgi:hypothetical protein